MKLAKHITLAFLVFVVSGFEQSAEAGRSAPLLGFTEFRTDLPGGRHTNVRTMRAMAVKADGSGRRELAAEIVREPDAWTQFAGWSPDGKTAVISRGWQSAENARWEEEHKQFRHTKDGWLVDAFLVELATGRATNITAVERGSNYHGGLFFWPGADTKLGFPAIIDGHPPPFRLASSSAASTTTATRTSCSRTAAGCGSSPTVPAIAG